MSTDTTIPPAPVSTPPADRMADHHRELVAGLAERAAGRPFANLALGQDPERAREVCAQIQAGSRRAERDGIQRSSRDGRVLRILDAANALAAVSADDPDDEIGRGALQLVHDLREFAARFVTVPAPSRIRHEVPGTEAAA